MKYLKYIFLFFCFLFWPVSLIKNNPSNWVPYIISGLFIYISIYLFSKSSSRLKLLSVVFIILAMFPTIKEISGNSIFKFDPLVFDTQVKKVALIPNRTLARIVQNKYLIFVDKFTANIFTNLDTNNFFFSLHPRETGNTQNLNKFSYTALPFFLFGIFVLFSKRKKYLLYYFLISVILLSLTPNFDRLDFILWPTIFLIIIKGTVYVSEKYPRISTFYFLFSLPLIIFDFVRIILRKG